MRLPDEGESANVSRIPSRSKISMFCSAIAAQSGWPPNVMPCLKVTFFSMSGRPPAHGRARRPSGVCGRKPFASETRSE